jgi:hypothetical protein
MVPVIVERRRKSAKDFRSFDKPDWEKGLQFERRF